MKKIRPALSLAFLVLLCTAGIAQAFAPAPHGGRDPFVREVFLDFLFGKKEGQKPAVKQYYIQDDKTFEENTTTVHMRPYNSASLEFDVVLPNNWTADDLTKGQPPISSARDGGPKMVGSMARITSEMISVYRLQIMVMAQPLEREISAENWLKGYIFENGYALQGEVVGEGVYRAHVFFNSVDNQVSYFSYLTVHITGGYAFICRADVPLPIKDFAAYIQKKVADSLRVTYPREQNIESTKNFALVDSVRFSYPISWQTINPDFKDMSRLSVQLQNKGTDGSLDGFIRILAVKRRPETNLMKEMELLKQHLGENMNVDIRSLAFSRTPPDYSQRFVFAREEIYKAAFRKERTQDPEVHLAVFGDKTWYVIMYMISPREQDDLDVWAHNIRCFEIMMASFR